MARNIYGMHQPLHTTSAAHRTCASGQGWRYGRFGGRRAITIGAAEIRLFRFDGRASLAGDRPSNQRPDHGKNKSLAISKKDGRQRHAKASEPHSKGSIRIAHHQPNYITSRTTSAAPHRQPHTGSYPQPATPGTFAIASNVVVMLPTNSSSSSVAVISSPTRSWISG